MNTRCTIDMTLFRYSAARTMKGNHCQQCYAKIPKGERFCPKCGWAMPDYEPDDDSRKEYRGGNR